MKPFPPLNFSHRIREFNCYSEKQRAAVVYHWLVTGMATRKMDEQILGMNKSSKGYQSHGIYRYLGLDRTHQGFFREWQISDIVSYFHQLCRDPDYCIIFYYILDYLDQSSFSERDNLLIAETKEQQPEESLKDQTWIRNTWIGHASLLKRDINKRLLELPDVPYGTEGKVIIKHGGKTEYYSNTTVKETIKNLYDFHCQICGDVILKTGWQDNMGRVDSWRYLSADVHHILPLSKKGPDLKSNMLCLCPTCHRKFHSGEFQIKQNKNNFYVRDELLARNLNLQMLHNIILY